MEIKNKLIRIKSENKETVLHNYIYDNYLKMFIDDQLSYTTRNKDMNYLYLKFEDELQDYKNAQISDFDIRTTKKSMNIEGNSQKVLVSYFYDETEGFYEAGSYTRVDIEDYYNKKITAIGFGSMNTLYACVDTSKYSIYIYQNEILNIIREDEMSSDAICKGTEFPLHLAPYLERTKISNGSSYSYYDTGIKLYSIGLGFIQNEMNAEYIIGEDIDTIRESDTSFGFNLKKGENLELHPSVNLYTGTGLYPMAVYKEREIHPRTNLYASNSLYPMQSNYKYIIYKYEIYAVVGAATQTVGYYTMNLFNETKGLFEIITKIERR